MAHYLIVDESGELPLIRSMEGKNIPRVVAHLIAAGDIKPGEKVTIYRTAGPGRKVSVHESVDIKLVIE